MSSSPVFDHEAFRRFEERGHDRVAAGYEDFFAPVTTRTVEPLLDAAGVGSIGCVLDVATGPGVVAAHAGRRGARMVGVDLSARMIEVARARYPHIEFCRAQAEALPFKAATFDAVVCNFGIGHFPHPESAAREFARVVAPGGTVALSWWHFPHARLNGVFLDAIAEAGVAAPPAGLPTGPPVTRFSDDPQLVALLEGAGLRDVVVRATSWTERPKSIEDWWRGGLGSLVRASAGVLGHPPDVQARIRAAFDRLAEGYRTADGLVVPMAAKIVSGRAPLA